MTQLDITITSSRHKPVSRSFFHTEQEDESILDFSESFLIVFNSTTGVVRTLPNLDTSPRQQPVKLLVDQIVSLTEWS